MAATDDIPQSLIDKFEADKPSAEPTHWAKSGCKYCYGRGIVGKHMVRDKDNNTFQHELLCICARKNFKRWKEQWMDENIPSRTPAPPKNGSKKAARKAPSLTNVLSRIDRIEDQLAVFNGQAGQYSERIEGLPHKAQLSELQKEKDGLKLRLSEEESVNQELENQISQFQTESGQLESRAKELMSQAVFLEKEVSQRRVSVLSAIVNDLKEVDNRMSLTHADFEKQSKGWRRKLNELGLKIEKLVKRRDRVSSYAGFSNNGDGLVDIENRA